MDAVYAALAFIGAKAGTIVTAAMFAGMGFLLDSRRHSVWTAVLALAAGTTMAVVFTDPIVDYLGHPNWANGIAAMLGVGGRNLIMFINRVSQDPTELVRFWRGDKGRED
jgi:hypothetical protein